MQRLALRVMATQLAAGAGLAAAALLTSEIAVRSPSPDSPSAPETRAAPLVAILALLREGHGALDWLLPDRNGDRK